MLSTMAMEVVPGVGLGPFQLGDSLWHVLDQLRSNKVRFPKVELQWNPEDPASSAVTVHLPLHLILYFPPSIHQRLQLLKVPDLSKSTSAGLSLTYETQVISSSNIGLTRATVGRVLGPTFDNSSGKDGKSDLHFPGISFGFTERGRDSREDAVATVIISQGSKPDDYIPKTIKDVPALQGELKSCIIEPGKGVTLRFYPTPKSAPLQIIIGETTSQDLLLDLGPPLRKFWKEDNRMQRMWGKTEKQTSMACFWNYFQHGLDFLVDESDHLVKKIIIHSNIPGTPMFQRYARCPWSIASSSDNALTLTSPLSALSAGRAAGEEGSFINGDPDVAPSSKTSITKQERRKDKDGGPGEGVSMMLDRVGEGGLEGVIGLGTSRTSPSKKVGIELMRSGLIGLKGMVLEHEEHGGIGSITVF